jgi:hypothetical protein
MPKPPGTQRDAAQQEALGRLHHPKINDYIYARSALSHCSSAMAPV